MLDYSAPSLCDAAVDTGPQQHGSPSMFKSLIEGPRGRRRLVRQAHIQAEESSLMTLVRVDSLAVSNARHGIATTVDLPRGI